MTFDPVEDRQTQSPHMQQVLHLYNQQMEKHAALNNNNTSRYNFHLSQSIFTSLYFNRYQNSNKINK